jgi:hypothetical protein
MLLRIRRQIMRRRKANKLPPELSSETARPKFPELDPAAGKTELDRNEKAAELEPIGQRVELDPEPQKAELQGN